MHPVARDPETFERGNLGAEAVAARLHVIQGQQHRHGVAGTKRPLFDRDRGKGPGAAQSFDCTLKLGRGKHLAGGQARDALDARGAHVAGRDLPQLAKAHDRPRCDPYLRAQAGGRVIGGKVLPRNLGLGPAFLAPVLDRLRGRVADHLGARHLAGGIAVSGHSAARDRRHDGIGEKELPPRIDGHVDAPYGRGKVVSGEVRRLDSIHAHVDDAAVVTFGIERVQQAFVFRQRGRDEVAGVRALFLFRGQQERGPLERRFEVGIAAGDREGDIVNRPGGKRSQHERCGQNRGRQACQMCREPHSGAVPQLRVSALGPKGSGMRTRLPPHSDNVSHL